MHFSAELSVRQQKKVMAYARARTVYADVESAKLFIFAYCHIRIEIQRKAHIQYRQAMWVADSIVQRRNLPRFNERRIQIEFHLQLTGIAP